MCIHPPHISGVDGYIATDATQANLSSFGLTRAMQFYHDNQLGMEKISKVVRLDQGQLLEPCICVSYYALYWHVVNSYSLGSRPSLYRSRTHIRESVDSLCRDGADMPRPPYIGKACTRPNLEDLSLFRYLSNVYESLCTQ